MIQNGKCSISGAVLVFKPYSDNQASVDRIDNNIGYVDGNCRLVCLEFNTSVKWSRKILLDAIAISGIPPENFGNEISDLETVQKEIPTTQFTKNGKYSSLTASGRCSVTTVQRRSYVKPLTNQFQKGANLAGHSFVNDITARGEAHFNGSLTMQRVIRNFATSAGRRTIRPSAHSRTCSS
jgi:hypothetical protein